jgi:predicted metal-dependent phosphoesterase TrpH
MLKFMRNKVIGIERRSLDSLQAHGILDDDIYSVELEVTIGLSDMVIRDIKGRFKRWTTPECPKAIAVLQDAVGFFLLTDGFEQKVQKEIGRKGCRHFASLLVECCLTAEKAAGLIKEQEDSPLLKVGDRKEFPDNESPSVVKSGPEREDGGLPRTKEAGERKIASIIDLHVHTFPASSCSVARVDDVIAEAKRIGLDGICLTDHNHVWNKKKGMELSQRHGFLVLRGNEVTTDQGDMLVFGLETQIQGIIRLEELRSMVSGVNGFIIAAHPFRGFLLFGSGQLGLTPEAAMQRPLFKCVDGVEILNGKVTETENEFAGKVAKELGLPGTGGSDAHQVSEIGVYATRFDSKIQDEKNLVEALQSGKYSAVAFRKSA